MIGALPRTQPSAARFRPRLAAECIITLRSAADLAIVKPRAAHAWGRSLAQGYFLPPLRGKLSIVSTVAKHKRRRRINYYFLLGIVDHPLWVVEVFGVDDFVR